MHALYLPMGIRSPRTLRVVAVHLFLGLGLLEAAPATAGWESLFRTAQYYHEGIATSSGIRIGSPYGVAVADFNLDGRPDAAVANSDYDTPTVRLHSLDARTFPLFVEWGIFENSFTPPGNYLHGIASTDFNLDGKPDIVMVDNAAGNFTGTLQVLLGPGFVTGGAYTVSRTKGLVATGDLNADGLPDVVLPGFVAAAYEFGIHVMLALNGTTLGPASTYYAPPTGVNPNIDPAIAVADATGDGVLDVLLAAQDAGPGGSFWIFVGNNSGTLWVLSIPRRTPVVSLWRS